MRIALFASAFHPAVGGVEEVVRQIAHGLRRSGHSAIVITNRWPRDMAAKDEYEGIPIYRLPLRTPDDSLKSQLSYFLTHRLIRKEIEKILRTEKIEIIHVHCVSTNAHYGLIAGNKIGLPVVVTSHSERTMDATQVFERSPFMAKVLRKSLSEANFVTACSRDTLDDLIQFMNGAICVRNRVVYNGINLNDFGRSDPSFQHPRPYIFALGRFVKQKGFDILLEAFAKADLKKTHDLILAGEGPQHDELEKMISDLSLTSAVTLPGKTSREESLALMANASFFVLSSRHEGFPMVCLEAMASARAIVATAVGGVPEAVANGVNGLLVSKENTAELGKAMRALADDETLRERLGKAGRERVTHLTWDVIVQEYLNVYGESAKACRS